jgi:hypothetical protein
LQREEDLIHDELRLARVHESAGVGVRDDEGKEVAARAQLKEDLPATVRKKHQQFEVVKGRNDENRNGEASAGCKMSTTPLMFGCGESSVSPGAAAEGIGAHTCRSLARIRTSLSNEPRSFLLSFVLITLHATWQCLAVSTARCTVANAPLPKLCDRMVYVPKT